MTPERVGLQCAQSSATTDHGGWGWTGMETRNIGEVVGDLLLTQLILPLVCFQTQPLDLLLPEAFSEFPPAKNSPYSSWVPSCGIVPRLHNTKEIWR